MFRRPFARPIRHGPAGEIPPALQRANQLMAAGQYAQAAEIFEQFAQRALARNGPRAPWFFLQAGQARLLAGETQAGMAHLRQGLALFATRGQWAKFLQSGTRLISELYSRGSAAEAKQIEDYIQATLPPGLAAGLGIGAEKTRPILPTNCPGCGGPLRSDEVEWVDEVTAECPYCGSAVRAE